LELRDSGARITVQDTGNLGTLISLEHRAGRLRRIRILIDGTTSSPTITARSA
jgi:hypothetical protein